MSSAVAKPVAVSDREEDVVGDDIDLAVGDAGKAGRRRIGSDIAGAVLAHVPDAGRPVEDRQALATGLRGAIEHVEAVAVARRIVEACDAGKARHDREGASPGPATATAPIRREDEDNTGAGGDAGLGLAQLGGQAVAGDDAPRAAVVEGEETQSSRRRKTSG